MHAEGGSLHTAAPNAHATHTRLTDHARRGKAEEERMCAMERQYAALPPERHAERKSALLTGLPVLAIAAFLILGATRNGGPLSVNAAKEIHSKDRVLSLPGLTAKASEQFAKQLHYAGTVTVKEITENKLFYWFVESARGEPVGNVPLIMWLNGGPGASSMTGFLVEGIGPFLLGGGSQLHPNAHSWHTLGHVLTFDQPVGTGFSTTASADGFVKSMDEMAAQLLAGLEAFYALHPEYRASPLFVTGESFAGKYIPAFCAHIHNVNAATPDDARKVNLAGLAIGNGVFKPLLQTEAIPALATALGYVDEANLTWVGSALGRCKALIGEGEWRRAYGACQEVEDRMYGAAAPFIYDVRETVDAFSALSVQIGTYLNQPPVRSALHVSEAVWSQADGGQPGNQVSDNLWRDQIEDTPDAMLVTLLEHYRVLMYAGNFDGSSCNQLGVGRTLAALRWRHGGAEIRLSDGLPRCLWRHEGEAAGMVQRAGSLSWVVLVNSGHLVPMNQPAHAHEMVRRFLDDSVGGLCS